ncbi:MAG: hypothetical protein ACR2QC_02660 [Gammaproteobacteria bacterium]
MKDSAKGVKITSTYLRYGIVPVRGLANAPEGGKSMRVAVLFDDAKIAQELTYDPVNRRFFGARGWYKARGASVGDFVFVETVKAGELYRLRILPALASFSEAASESESLDSVKRSKKKGRVDAITGEPINYRGLVYAPINEMGVVLLFGMLYNELGMIVESVQTSFPDAVVRRFNGRGWVKESVEFEYESANFRAHGHPPEECDMIVCWRHNWRGCPTDVEVCELSRFVRELPADAIDKINEKAAR